MTSKPQFPHRHNNDGTFDAICNKCFVTIARVEAEGDLFQFEARHVCDAANLYGAGQGGRFPAASVGIEDWRKPARTFRS